MKFGTFLFALRYIFGFVLNAEYYIHTFFFIFFHISQKKVAHLKNIDINQ